MADKRITDFATLAEAQDDDLLLVASEDETYNIKVKTLKEAVQGDADRAEAAAQDAKKSAKAVKIASATPGSLVIRPSHSGNSGAKNPEPVCSFPTHSTVSVWVW